MKGGDIAIARFYALCIMAFMTGEKPKPMIVRFYKNERRAIKRWAKVYKWSEAKTIRYAVGETLGELKDKK